MFDIKKLKEGNYVLDMNKEFYGDIGKIVKIKNNIKNIVFAIKWIYIRKDDPYQTYLNRTFYYIIFDNKLLYMDNDNIEDFFNIYKDDDNIIFQSLINKYKILSPEEVMLEML